MGCLDQRHRPTSMNRPAFAGSLHRHRPVGPVAASELFRGDRTLARNRADRVTGPIRLAVCHPGLAAVRLPVAHSRKRDPSARVPRRETLGRRSRVPCLQGTNADVIPASFAVVLRRIASCVTLNLRNNREGVELFHGRSPSHRCQHDSITASTIDSLADIESKPSC